MTSSSMMHEWPQFTRPQSTRLSGLKPWGKWSLITSCN